MKNVKPVRTKADYKAALERIEELKSLISTNKLPSAVKVESN
jgi:antitoxin component HigA of HigAB toxin-antitoxin module